MCAAVDAGDLAILSAVFRALESSSLRAGPSTMGMLSLAQSLAMALATPCWGLLADQCPRRVLLACGVASWTLTAWLTAMATTVPGLVVCRALNGIGLSVINPIAFTILSDLYPDAQRGKAFGLLALSASVGSTLSSVAATVAAARTFGSLSGWRVAFIVAGMVSACLVPAVLSIPEPSQPRAQAPGARSGACAGLRLISRSVWRNRTLQVITLQGLFGNIPWQAFNFLTLWLLYLGQPDALAAAVANVFRVGTAVGGLAGGLLSDMCHAHSAAHGRVFLVQAADAARLPLVYLLFRGGSAAERAPGRSAAGRIVGSLLLMGLFAPVVGISNRAILAEASPASARASTLAFNAALEGIFASLVGGPLVGVLAERAFGYRLPERGSSVAQMDEATRSRNADALGSSLCALTIVPWTICLILYTFVHCTFARDVKRARRADARSAHRIQD
jgi:MFS family permease